jgi:hypothetical protein
LGQRAVARGQEGDPFAYLLPPAPDAGARAHLANLLLATGVEVLRAERPFTADTVGYPAGTLVVPLAQPFRAHAKDLLEVQRYPDTGRAPYDVTGWTLPLAMGVPAVAVRDRFRADLVRVDTVEIAPGRIVGTGGVFLLANRSAAEARAIAALLAAGQTVAWVDSAVVAWGPQARAILGRHAAIDGFDVRAVTAAPLGVQGARNRLPRIAIYQPRTAPADEGWTRWAFEQYGVSYTTVHDSVLRNGALRRRFDVLVLPHEDSERIAQGRDTLSFPAAYAGGLGEAGTAAVAAFVRGGGTLVTLGASSSFAISTLNIPVRNVLAGDAQTQQASRFSAPGSILGVDFGLAGSRGRPPSPVLVGVPESLAVMFDGGGVFGVQGPAVALGRYRAEPLRSGFARNAASIQDLAAGVEAPVGRGKAVLFGFRPQFRGQTHATFRLLFNAVLLAAP